MKNKKGRVLGYSLLLVPIFGAIYLGWALFPGISDFQGIPKAVKYQAPPDEQVVTTQTAVPTDTVFTYQDHRYQLAVEVAPVTLSPLAGSRLTGKIRLLKDGSPTREVPAFLTNSRSVVATSGIPNDKPVVLLDLAALDQQMSVGRIYLGDTATSVGDNDTGSTLSARTVGWTIDGTPTDASPYFYLTGGRYIASPQALQVVGGSTGNRTGVLDFSTGEAEFTYQTDGVRASQSVDIVVRSYDKNLVAGKRVAFADTKQSRVAVPKPTITQTNRDLEYEIVTSMPTVMIGEVQKLTIGVVAKNPRTGQINQQPGQRIRLTVAPLWSVFVPTRVQPRTNATKGTYTIAGDIKIKQAGKFVVTDEVKYKYGANLDHGGERSATRDEADPMTIYLDLVEGKTAIDFEYSGGLSPLPYLTIYAQPANFFAEYPGWDDKPPAVPTFKDHSWDEWVRRCEDDNTCQTWDADIRAYVNTPPYYRESAGITYPPLPDDTVTRLCRFENYSYGTSNCGEWFLYQDSWYTRADFTQLVATTTAYTVIPLVQTQGRSQAWLWWWFITLQLATLTGFLIRLWIYKKRR